MDYFQEKLTWQNFSKNPKSLILGQFGALSAQTLTKNEFSWKKRALSVFQYLNYLPLCQKSEKSNDPFLRKLLDGHKKHFLHYFFVRLIEKSPNLIGQEHFGPYPRNQNFTKYEICSSIQELQQYKVSLSTHLIKK